MQAHPMPTPSKQEQALPASARPAVASVLPADRLTALAELGATGVLSAMSPELLLLCDPFCSVPGDALHEGRRL